jgi:transposase
VRISRSTWLCTTPFRNTTTRRCGGLFIGLGPGSLLGLAPGRTGACVRDWLGAQTGAFRNAIKIVVIDPSAPYSSGIRAALQNVKIAVLLRCTGRGQAGSANVDQYSPI